MNSTMQIAFDATVGHEGDTLDLDPNDRGNWTGGRVGAGELRGSKFGIAAAFHPGVDIAALTRAQAEEIYEAEYWRPICGDDLPAPLAVMVFDSAINNGVTGASEMLQAAVGVYQDGVVGPQTLTAVKAFVLAFGLARLCAEFLAHRIVREATAPIFRQDALGLARRLAAQPFEALRAGPL